MDLYDDLPADLRDELVRSEIAKNLAEAESLRLDNENKALQLSTLKSVGDAVNVYTFYGPVTEESVHQCIQRLDMWSRRNPECDITVIFNSPGGYVNDGFALYDFLRELSRRGHKVITRCLGTAASMGAILMQAGDERVMGPTSFMMIHEISGTLQGKASEIDEQRKWVEKLENKALDILAKRSTLTRATIKRRWHKRDWVLDADEAVELGFADRVEDA